MFIGAFLVGTSRFDTFVSPTILTVHMNYSMIILLKWIFI